ncbi:MAG: nucleoside triphosphate pyrophosphatase [Armatimonadota bacterium]
MENIILASKSPRRVDLLKKITGNFTVFPSSADETSIKEKDPVRFAVKAAVIKAKEVGDKFPHSVVIGADTIVVFNNEILGKPGDLDHAREMLKVLSGNTHTVITGIAVYKKDDNKLLTDYEETRVKFKELPEEVIDNYLNNHEVLDKAGSYGIQTIKDEFVEDIKGDYDNVVGLPVERLRKLLSVSFFV